MPLNASLSSSGLITWTPAATGNQSFEFSFSDDRGVTSTVTLPITVDSGVVNELPAISSTAPATAQLGLTYKYLVVASDEDGDKLTYSLDSGPGEGPPAGMTIDPNTGLITWTPSSGELGVNQVQVRVNDGVPGGDAVEPFTVDVETQAANSPPNITSTPPLAAVVARQYVYDLVGSDPDGDFLAWSLDQAPLGMSINPEQGTILWQPTPDEVGPQKVIVRVTDTAGLSITQPYTITVRGEDTGPLFTSDPVETATIGQQYTYAVGAADPDGDTLRYSLGQGTSAVLQDQSAPNDLRIDANTGIITWTPAAGFTPGTYSVEVDVYDDVGVGMSQTYPLVVSAAAPPPAPLITSGTPPAAAAYGEEYQYQFTATTPSGYTPTYTLTGTGRLRHNR